MSTQAEFGNGNDPVVAVPGSLRGFRYFRGTHYSFSFLSAFSGSSSAGVFSMQWSTDWSVPGWQAAKCNKTTPHVKGIPPSCRGDSGCGLVPTSHAAGLGTWVCCCQQRLFPQLTMVGQYSGYHGYHFSRRIEVKVDWVSPHAEDPAPHSGCFCGFYASYTADELQYAPGTFGAKYIGVVEAAGRVILGTKGYRAERMKIVALAPADTVRAGAGEPDIPQSHAYSSYGDIESLTQAYPPEDVSELIGKKPEPKGMLPDRVWLDEATGWIMDAKG